MESNSAMTILAAVGSFLQSLKKKDNADQELFRFVNWCGSERVLSEISPVDIEDYVARTGGSGMSVQAAERLQVIRRFLSYARKKGMLDQNLARHVRIPRAKIRTAKQRLAQEQQTIGLTAGGHAKLTKELEKLKSERVPLAEQIRLAAADKDVRENVPLEAAREQLGQLESRILTIEETLRSAVIIGADGKKRDRTIRLGANVVIRDVDSGKRITYRIVSAMEANPAEGTISDASPVGNALVGHTVGDEVPVVTPGGNLRYRVMRVST